MRLRDKGRAERQNRSNLQGGQGNLLVGPISVRVQLPNGGLRGAEILRAVPSRFWSSEGSHEEPSKDPPEGTVEESPAGRSGRPRNASAAAAALPLLPSALKESAVFHILKLQSSLHSLSAHRPGRRERAISRATAGHDDGRYSSGWRRAPCSCAELKEATKLAASRRFGRSGAVAGRASRLDTSTGEECEALARKNDMATAANVRHGSTCSSASSSSRQRCSGGESEEL